MKQTWTIVIYDNMDENIECHRLIGTIDQIKEALIEVVNGDIIVDRENWEYGTESVNDIKEDAEGQLYAYGSYKNHIRSYYAMPEEEAIDIDNRKHFD